MRRCLTHSLLTLAALAVTTPAFAQDPNCPPGAWFCEPAEPTPAPEAKPPAEAPAPEAAETDGPPPLPKAEPAPAKRPKSRVVPPPPPGSDSPIVVYPQRGTSVVIVPKNLTPPPPPPPPKQRFRSEWGLNLRIEGALMGRRAEQDAGMGGFGFSFRARPVPAFALDMGLDFVAGVDFNGDTRTEIPLSVSTMLFVNPKSKVQVYFIGGVSYTHAEIVDRDFDGFDAYREALASRDSYYGGWGYDDDEYDYLGGHVGVGLEFRLSKRFALNTDLVGFVRSRIDDAWAPEFENPFTRESTNTSGGGLARFGLTFYW